MKNPPSSALLPDMHWLFNTPFVPYLDNHRIDRLAHKSDFKQFFVSVRGEWVWFLNYQINPTTIEKATVMQVVDTQSRYRSLRFCDNDSNPVTLAIVFKYIQEHQLFGYSLASAMALFSEVCNGKTSKHICEDWNVSRHNLILSLDRITAHLRIFNPEACAQTPAGLRGLKKHSAHWLTQMESFKAALRANPSLIPSQE